MTWELKRIFIYWMPYNLKQITKKNLGDPDIWQKFIYSFLDYNKSFLPTIQDTNEMRKKAPLWYFNHVHSKTSAKAMLEMLHSSPSIEAATEFKVVIKNEMSHWRNKEIYFLSREFDLLRFNILCVPSKLNRLNKNIRTIILG